MTSDYSENGFTLVEMLLAMVISGIIIGGIASILIVTLQSYPRSAAKLSISDNAQLLSSFLVPDVQSAGGTDAAIQAPPADNSACAVPAGVPATDELRLTWSDFDVAGSSFSADYCLVGSELIRYYRQGGGGATQSVVSRDVALPGGVVVHTGRSTSAGDEAAVPTVDSVDIEVTTTDLVNGSPYQFRVSASRRTPALRISAVPDINIARAAIPGLVNGTAEPSAMVSLSITDAATPPNTIGPMPIAAAYGQWGASGIPWANLKDGLVTFNVQTQDSYGRTSTATTTAFKDTTAPTAQISPASGFATTLPLNFVVTFSEHINPDLVAGAFTVTPRNASVASVTPPIPCAPGSDPASECFGVSVQVSRGGGDGGDDEGRDGNVTLIVNANTVTDDSGNPNTASNLASITLDLSAPTVTLAPIPPTATSTQPLQFLATFTKDLDRNLKSSGVTVSVPSNPPVVTSVACPPPNECFIISVSGLPNTDTGGGPVSVSVNAGAVTDNEGRPNPPSGPSAPITWVPLTIHETGPNNAATFNGVAGPAPGTVAVSICSDATCSAPTPPQTIPVQPDGTWQWGPTDLGGSQFAEVTQTLSGVTKTTFAGPFP